MKYAKAIIFNMWKIYLGFVFVTTLLVFYLPIVTFMQFKKFKKYTFTINVIWSRVFRILTFYAIHIEDNRKEKLSSPFIICANHTSYLDIFLMYSIFPKSPFLFMGKSEILSYPLVKTFFKGLNIAVFRDDRVKAAKSFIQARSEMKNNWCIVIFPEGGIPDEPPYLIPFKDGTFKLAKSSNVGIQPITFVNNYKLFSDPEFVFQSARPGLAKVVFHPIIDTKKINDLSIEEINKLTFDRINSCLPRANSKSH